MRLFELISLQIERLNSAIDLFDKLQEEIPAGTPDAKQYAQNVSDGRASIAARKQFLDQLEAAQIAVDNYTTHQSVFTLNKVLRSYKALFVNQSNPIAPRYFTPQSDPTLRMGFKSCRRKMVTMLRNALEEEYKDPD